jgi:hypothetical protein
MEYNFKGIPLDRLGKQTHTDRHGQNQKASKAETGKRGFGEEEIGRLRLSVQHKMQSMKYNVRASAINNSTSCWSFGPSTALHPLAHISIRTGGCAL